MPSIATLSAFGWTLMILVTIGYCAVTGILFLRKRRYVAGFLGLMCAVGLLFAPIKTHAIKIDLDLPLSVQSH